MTDFSFEKSGVEVYIDSCHNQAKLSACRVLSMLTDEDDDELKSIFDLIHSKKICIDVADISLCCSTAVSERLEFERRFVSEGADPTGLPESDPLKTCLSDLSEYDALKEKEIISRLYNGEDVSQQLFLAGMPRVIRKAMEYAGLGVFLADLIQEANLSLWQMIQTYHGKDYLNESEYEIEAALEKAVVIQARNDGIGKKISDSMQAYKRVSDAMIKKLGRTAGIEEIAEEMRTSPEMILLLQKMIQDAQNMSSFASAESEQEIDKEESDTDESVEDTAYYKIREHVSELLQQLNEQDAKIISMRFGLDQRLPMTLEEIAFKMNMTTKEVSERESEALAKLRTEGSV